MGLSAEVVNLIGLHGLDDTANTGRIVEIPKVQEEPRVGLVRIDVDMIDPIRVEGGCPTNDPMNLVLL